jgi:predicted transcriptional regulator
MPIYIDRNSKSLILTDMQMPKFKLRGSRPLSEAVVDALGELERQVMTEIREHGELSVRQIWEDRGKKLAYTTIMTTLDRLYKKGLLDRRKVSRAFVYKAKYSVAEMETGVARHVINSLLATSTDRVEPMLACIVDAVSERDRQYLDELERLVHEKRRELETKK